MPEDINEWAKQRLNEGENPAKLKERLSAYGYDPSIVDNISSPKSNASTENKNGDAKKFKLNNLAIVGIIIIIIIGFFAFNFLFSILDLWKNQNLETQQAVMMERADKGEITYNELMEFVKTTSSTCKELKNYIFFGNHKDVCYENTLIFYMSQIEGLSRNGKISPEDAKQTFEEAYDFVLKEICPNIEDKKKRTDCENIPQN